LPNRRNAGGMDSSWDTHKTTTRKNAKINRENSDLVLVEIDFICVRLRCANRPQKFTYKKPQH